MCFFCHRNPFYQFFSHHRKVWVKAFNPELDQKKTMYMFMRKIDLHWAETGQVAKLYKLTPRMDYYGPDGNYVWEAHQANYADFSAGVPKSGIPIMPVAAAATPMPQDLFFTIDGQEEGESFRQVDNNIIKRHCKSLIMHRIILY